MTRNCNIIDAGMRGFAIRSSLLPFVYKYEDVHCFLCSCSDVNDLFNSDKELWFDSKFSLSMVTLERNIIKKNFDPKLTQQITC